MQKAKLPPTPNSGFDYGSLGSEVVTTTKVGVDRMSDSGH